MHFVGWDVICITLLSMRYKILTKSHFVCPAGKPIIPHLRRYQGLAVVYYGFTLGCLGSGAFSTFDQLGYTNRFSRSILWRFLFDRQVSHFYISIIRWKRWRYIPRGTKATRHDGFFAAGSCSQIFIIDLWERLRHGWARRRPAAIETMIVVKGRQAKWGF